MKASAIEMSDYELIQQCLKGNTAYYEELVDRYKNLVYSIILRMITDKEEANDLAQDVFMKVYQNLAKYSTEFKFSTWVMRITTNHVIDYRRKKKQEYVPMEEVGFDIAATDSPEGEYIQKERKESLQGLLNDLPDMYKVPIVLYHQQGLSYQEIAESIGEPLSKVKNRILRGRKILKETIFKMKEGGSFEL